MDATDKPSRTRTFAGRGVCAECATDLTLIAGGLVIAHGPRDARCPGGGRPPRPSEPVAEASPTDDTAAEPSAAVEPASAPVRYQEGDRVRSGGLLGTVEAVYGSTVEVTWDDGRAQTRDADSIERIGRPEAEPVAEVAAPPTVPAYTRLDEDDGEIDGGAVTPRAETSRRDIPADIPEPSLLGMAQRSRIEQLEADAARLLPDGEAQRRRIAVLESQLDASREEVAALNRRLTDALAERDMLSREAAASAADARRSRDTLRGALDLIGRLGPA